jgi:perosamine synthetase
MQKRIPLFRPTIYPEAIAAVNEVLNSGWLGAGPKTKAFEKAFAEYVGALYCVGLNSCTSALHLGLHLLDLKPGSEVITTPLTFVSTNHAILYEKCKPVFADVQSETGNLDVPSVTGRITDHTGAIMLVHYGGYPADIDEFYTLAKEAGIPIVEDCAHACGATYKGKRVGSQGLIHAFSFDPVKNLTMGGGGALIVRSPDHDSRLKKLRWLGIDADTFKRTADQRYKWEYNVPEVGYNYYMNDIQAAIGLAQLSHLDEDNARRTAIVGLYRQRLSNVPGIKLLSYKDDRKSSYHLFSILAEKRDDLVNKLRDAGVDVGVHYQRNDLYPMYEKQDLPNVEYFWKREISLPMHLQLTDEHVDYITDVIRKGW